MATQDLLEQILQTNITLPEALKGLADLKEFMINKLFGGTAPPSEALASQFPNLSELICNLDQKNVYEIFDQTEAALKATQPLIICVSSPLPPENIKEIARRVKQDFGKNFLIEIKIEPELIGGAALVFRGIYKDYSLRQRLLDHKTEILQILEKYVSK